MIKYILACLLLSLCLFGDAGNEFYTVEQKKFEYRHTMRVTAMTEKSERIVNPQRWIPLEYFAPDGQAVKKGDVIARFDSTQSLFEEKSQVLDLEVVESELEHRLKSIDNKDLEMSDQLGDLEDKLASQEAKLERLLKEPTEDDVRIAEGKLKIAALNLRLSENDFRRAEGRFKRGMISRAELDSVERTHNENIVKYTFADRELELTMAPVELPYNIARTRLEIKNSRLEIEKLKTEIAEQVTLSQIQKNGAVQKKKRKVTDLEDLRRDISNMVVRAPIDGFVSHRRIHGDELRLGMRLWNNMAFMEIPNMETIGFQGTMLESVRKHFAIGDRVLIRVNGRKETVVECKLSQISTLSRDLSEKQNERENQERKYGVKVFDVVFSMTHGEEWIRPGMVGEAEVIASNILEGPAVPLKYVKLEEGKHYLVVDGENVEVNGTACDGWFVLDDSQWLGKQVGMRSRHGILAVQRTDADEKRLVVSGELAPVRKTDVKVGDIGWWPWPKVTKLVPEESVVKKGDILAELDPKEREKQILQQETRMAELKSTLEETEKNVETTRRNGEYQIAMAKNSLEIQRLTTYETIEEKRYKLSYWRALMNRDLAQIKLLDCRRKVEREKVKKTPTLSPVEMKKLERDLKRAELTLEKNQLSLDKESEGSKEVERSRARLNLLEQESKCEIQVKSATFNNAGMKREFERIKNNMVWNERNLNRRIKQKEEHTVRAPVDGLICYNKVRGDGGFQKISVGSSVGPRFTIMTIPDLSEMEVMVEVPEQYFPELKVGLPVEVRVPSLSDELLTGQVAKIDLLFTNRGRKDSDLGLYSSHEPLGEVVFKVRVHFQSGNLALKPGLVSEVYFPFAR